MFGSDPAIGMSSIVISLATFGNSFEWDVTVGNLEQEDGSNLLQENGSLILVEKPYA